MKFKSVEVIKDSLFSSFKFIASYNSYMDDDNMLEKFSTCVPRKGDVIRVKDKNTHLDVFLNVKHVCIDYIKDELTIWCK